MFPKLTKFSLFILYQYVMGAGIADGQDYEKIMTSYY